MKMEGNTYAGFLKYRFVLIKSQIFHQSYEGLNSFSHPTLILMILLVRSERFHNNLDLSYPYRLSYLIWTNQVNAKGKAIPVTGRGGP
jgi:hypothetical protein